MGRITFKKGTDYALRLSRLYAFSDEISQKAIYAAAGIVADAIKTQLKTIPTEPFRYLRDGDKFDGLTEYKKQDLIDSFGIAKIDVDKNGDWNTKLGFDGYAGPPTKKYPRGLPNQLIARAIESGSSVRMKHPFVRPAVNASRKHAQNKMAKVVEEEIKKLGL